MRLYERDKDAKVLRVEYDTDELPIRAEDLALGCETELEADRLWAAGVPAVAPGWRISVALQLPERARLDLMTLGHTALDLSTGKVVTDETIQAEMVAEFHRMKAKEGAGA